MSDSDKTAAAVRRLLGVMQTLRNPDGGCPWDLEQNFQSLVRYTLEEAYEVADAIETGDPAAIQDELGDLLFQVVFYAEMARQQGLFDFADIAEGSATKMIARHPHVFGDADAKTAEAVLTRWEADKAAKRAAAAKDSGKSPSALDGLTATLPALSYAVKLQQRAARVGFEWPDTRGALHKVEEELAELIAEYDRTPQDKAALEEELGDVFFALSSFTRRIGADPETIIRAANRKFERRFRGMEQAAEADGRSLSDYSNADLFDAWNRVKNRERTGG
jgi:nucleoside triphosphate diphosphatase